MVDGKRYWQLENGGMIADIYDESEMLEYQPTFED